MFSNFRSLPPIVRIGIALVVAAVLIAALAIIGVLVVGGGAAKPKPTSAPRPAPSVSVSVAPGGSPTPTPSPTSSLQQQLNNLPDVNGSTTRKITGKDNAEIVRVAQAGYLAWCTHDSHAAKTPAAVEQQYYAKINRYFLRSAEQADPKNYYTFIQDQACEIQASQVQDVAQDGTVRYDLYATTVTRYTDDAPGQTKGRAYVAAAGGTLYLKKIDGQWKIAELDANN